MHAIRPVVVGVTLLLAVAPGARASQTQGAATSSSQSSQKPDPQKPAPPKPDEPKQDVSYKETVVVSASKTEQQLIDAPATITVIGEKALNVSPSNNYGDILRMVPGVNVSQMSARDVNVTSRAATSSLATSQLAVLDGRSLYQDFFGFVMWDFMPVNMNEIKRIEVIRGPASAVWGANALDGVINVITKTPREMPGTSLTIGGGGFGRDFDNNGATAGSLFNINITHAQAVNDRWAYKVSAGTYTSDPYGRPTGLVPNVSGKPVPYPPYNNTGTTQPKFDARVDYDEKDGGHVSMSGGVAGTSGIMQSGIGPFDINSGAYQDYGKLDYTKKAFKLQVFLNHLNGNADQLLTTDAQGQPITFSFVTNTFDVEVGNVTAVGKRNALTYGGNIRYNTFDLSIAPNADNRTDGGAYLQDEIFMNDKVRASVGARLDKFSSISGAVFSPRVALVLHPDQNNTFRVSYNRAYRAPSAINNFLDVQIAKPIQMSLFHPAYGSTLYLLPIQSTGNPDLQEETLDAFEVGYTGNVRDRALVSIAYYYNHLKNQILFTQVGTYPQAPPPPDFPALTIPGLGTIPGAAIYGAAYAQGVRLPSEFSYENFGREVDKGIELGVQGAITKSVTAFVNYSYQATPDVDFDLSEVNQPPHNRFNFGIACDTPRGFGSFTVSYVDRAFWQDVLDADYHGWTDAYTMVNLNIGARFANGRVSPVLKVTNLFNQQIQQHIFGDVIRRAVVGELRIQLPK
ncbi:MAG TPA: TonB-dependent receptor [Vicinamibacterales bacterium]|nr:TonB-dependent receptor [Vicinamibacterales bacterium]